MRNRAALSATPTTIGRSARKSHRNSRCLRFEPAAARRRLCMLHKRHHVGRVAFADNFNLCKAGVDLFQVTFGELHAERSPVLLKIANTLRARDGDEVIALSKNPSESQLCWCRAFLGGEVFYCVRQFKVGLQGFLAETRICPAPILGVKILK